MSFLLYINLFFSKLVIYHCNLKLTIHLITVIKYLIYVYKSSLLPDPTLVTIYLCPFSGLPSTDAP